MRRRSKEPPQERLSFGKKIARLGTRLRDPEWRRYGMILMAGKFLGLIVLLGAILTVTAVITHGPTVVSEVAGGRTAYADDPATASAPASGASMSMPASASAPAATSSATTAAASAPDPATTKPAMMSDVNAATQATAALVDPTKSGNLINPINTLWTLVAAFLVFGMQAGFTMLEAGFCRSRETVNVLVECVFDTCLCGVLYYAWGYAFMFGAGNGFIGWHDPNDATKSWLFLQNITANTTFGGTGIPVLAHWIFQFAFADCASTICSGSMIGRTGFWGDIIYSVGVSGFIYPIIGHWAWGPDGFLATMGTPNPTDGSYSHFLVSLGMNFHDFAGSTVVHTIGGTIALAGAIVLGPRLGRRFKRDGGGPMTPHDLTIAIVGGFILWFGWYGFNPGSSLSAMDLGGIGRISANTTLAACGAGLTAVFFAYIRNKKWDPGAITNGFLAGLVAITCPCYWVSPTGATLLGAVAGIIVVVATDVLEYLRIDDPIGAVPVHMINGIWGTLSLGLFATGEYSWVGSSNSGVPTIDPAATPFNTDGSMNAAYGLKGLFYGGGMQVLEGQVIGNLVITLSTFAAAMIMFVALKKIGILRISKQGELEGMDLHEHGISAYPEYVITYSAAPGSMPPEAVGAGVGEKS